VAVAVLAAAAFIPNASAAEPRLTKDRATALFLGNDKVADWLDRYPRQGRVTDATYEADASKCSAGAQGGCWTVHVWWSNKSKTVDAGEIAQGKVDDVSTRVTEAWTGPQVAWRMARGYEGAFGGKKINSLPVWLAFCAVFLLGLADFRRPLSVRNLDLLALLSFSVSLWYFNDGNIFTSVPLAYPPLVYLLVRCVWVGARGRPVRAARSLWKPAVLLAAAVFLIGFRVGLNLEDSNVIDVGYAGVIGAQRISSGVMPYDNFPKEDDLKACGPADSAGEIRERIQSNGRCESANPLWLTYPGPVRRPRPALAFAAGFLVATLVAFSVLLLDGHPVQAAQTFYDRTLKTQITRESPFSPWDWAQYHARGIPDLHVVQRVLEVLLVVGAVAASFVPPTKTPLQLAALTGAILIGFEIVLTHWFYLYIPWFFPFVVFALLWNAPEQPETRI
jgi:hypothetical protein